MQVPLKIALRNILPQYKEEIEAEVREWAEKLEKFYPGIISCRVVVEMPHVRHQEGNLYKASVSVTVPQKQIVVSRDHPLHHSNENFRVAVRDAFEDASRQLQDFALIKGRELKHHDPEPRGVVTKIFPDGYGFIESPDGREIYFHRNSVLDGFEKLRIGADVRFREELGEKGPQASTVKIHKKSQNP